MASFTSSSSPASYWLSLALALAACFGAQTLVLRWTGGRTTKSESNFFSSVARVQSGVRGTPRVMLLGSSIAGRLPDRNRGFEGVGNLGCDGESAVEVLRAIDAGTIPGAPVLVIEGNTLFRAIDRKEAPLADTMESHWFHAGIGVPNLSAGGRPSAIVYTLLMERKMGRTDVASTQPLAVSTKPAPIVGEGALLAPGEEALVEELAGILRKLAAKGTRMTIVMYPPMVPMDSPDRRVPHELARRTGLPFWDLAGAIAPDAVRFTDAYHMDPPSAAAALRTILDATGD